MNRMYETCVMVAEIDKIGELRSRMEVLVNPEQLYEVKVEDSAIREVEGKCLL